MRPILMDRGCSMTKTTPRLRRRTLFPSRCGALPATSTITRRHCGRRSPASATATQPAPSSAAWLCSQLAERQFPAHGSMPGNRWRLRVNRMFDSPGRHQPASARIRSSLTRSSFRSMAPEQFIDVLVSRGVVGGFNLCASIKQHLDNRNIVSARVAVHDGPRRLTQNCPTVDVRHF